MLLDFEMNIWKLFILLNDGFFSLEIILMVCTWQPPEKFRSFILFDIHTDTEYKLVSLMSNFKHAMTTPWSWWYSFTCSYVCCAVSSTIIRCNLMWFTHNWQITWFHRNAVEFHCSPICVSYVEKLYKM